MQEESKLAVGLVGEHTVTVTKTLTATAMGSGELDVFATPAMLATMEAAAVNAIKESLLAGQTSVGIAVDIAHVAASPLGSEIRTRAEVVAVEERTVTFQVQAWDEHELIGEGTHKRVVIDAERFMQRMAKKAHTK